MAHLYNDLLGYLTSLCLTRNHFQTMWVVFQGQGGDGRDVQQTLLYDDDDEEEEEKTAGGFDAPTQAYLMGSDNESGRWLTHSA